MEEGIDWDLLVSKTELFSGDDISNVCRDASMMPLRREMSKGIAMDDAAKFQEIHERLRDVPISMEDFLEALSQVKPTNTRDKLERYQNWMAEHGST